uniref:Uncharacterized protein n=1 Tax=Naja naja TaxID=35670 RepID=A0A8C6YJY5_NAJNA
ISPQVESQQPPGLEVKVDNLLRCGICFDYFNTAMIIPQCSHNCKYRNEKCGKCVYAFVCV